MNTHRLLILAACASLSLLTIASRGLAQAALPTATAATLELPPGYANPAQASPRLQKPTIIVEHDPWYAVLGAGIGAVPGAAVALVGSAVQAQCGSTPPPPRDPYASHDDWTFSSGTKSCLEGKLITFAGVVLLAIPGAIIGGFVGYGLSAEHKLSTVDVSVAPLADGGLVSVTGSF